jgi:hypothetical protein
MIAAALGSARRNHATQQIVAQGDLRATKRADGDRIRNG